MSKQESGLLREEELKNKVREEYFGDMKKYVVSGDKSWIDFTVSQYYNPNAPRQDYLDFGDDFDCDFDPESYLWAEAKREAHDPCDMLTQLILTIGKHKINEQNSPPRYLGAFDNENFVFLEYKDSLEIFALNDIDWTATPSDYEAIAFKKARAAVEREEQGIHRQGSR